MTCPRCGTKIDSLPCPNCGFPVMRRLFPIIVAYRFKQNQVHSNREAEASMKNGKQPNPNVIHPINEYDKEIYIKLRARL